MTATAHYKQWPQAYLQTQWPGASYPLLSIQTLADPDAS